MTDHIGHNEALLSAEDAAAKLGFTKQTVSRLIRLGKLPAQKVGNKWVIHDGDLAQFFIDNNIIWDTTYHRTESAISLASLPSSI